MRVWGDNGEEDMQFAAIEGFYGSVDYLLDFERVEGTVALMLELYEKARKK